MACIALIANSVAMATTHLTDATYCELPQWTPAVEWEQPSLRMSWVVVTDESGKRQLRMCWQANQ